MTSTHRRCLLLGAAIGLTLPLITSPARADFIPGDVVISESVYQNTGEVAGLQVGQPIVVNGTQTAAAAVANGSNVNVFKNDSVDGNFGVASPLTLLQINPDTLAAGPSIALPSSQIVTSFASKSEGSLELSPDGHNLTIMGYHVADSANPVGALDVSNSDTIGGTSNGGTRIDDRTVAQINVIGQITTTDTNAYSGDNARAAILANNTYYAVGNASGGKTGVEQFTPGSNPTSSQQVGQFSITQVPPNTRADNLTKDNNFRGETVFNNTLYVTKGSGGNGIDTVYQVGAAGALANGASLTPGTGTPITILPGFPIGLAKSPAFTPFGLWFANGTTLYVGDEGSGGSSEPATAMLASRNGAWSTATGRWTTRCKAR
jgi:hypothetical protein